jgi:hypothetical protein
MRITVSGKAPCLLLITVGMSLISRKIDWALYCTKERSWASILVGGLVKGSIAFFKKTTVTATTRVTLYR